MMQVKLAGIVAKIVSNSPIKLNTNSVAGFRFGVRARVSGVTSPSLSRVSA